jgi:hypothetical protein
MQPRQTALITVTTSYFSFFQYFLKLDDPLISEIRKHVGVPAAADKKVSRADLKLADSRFIHLDIGGEGENSYSGITSGFRSAICVNAAKVQSAPPHDAIPNLILINSWGSDPSYPFADGFADYITMQNAPLTPKNVEEIARCLRPGGKVDLWVSLSFEEEIALLAKKLNSTPDYKVADEFKGSTGSPKTQIISGIKPANTATAAAGAGKLKK